MTWKVSIQGTQHEARDLDELKAWYREGRLPRDAYIFHPVLQRWMYPSELEELREPAAVPAPQDANRSSIWRTKISGCGGCLLLILFFMLSGLVLSLFSSESKVSKATAPVHKAEPPPPSPLDAPGVSARIARGEEIHERLRKQVALANPEVRGQLTDLPTLGFYMTNKMWNSLSREERVDYTWYAESMIPVARARPGKYVGIPISAPLHDTFVARTRNLCSDCWQIVLGDPVRRDGELTMTVDKVVVQGDTPWQADDACCRGAKASEFRIRRQ